MEIVTQSDRLQEICDQLIHQPYIAVDTEFLRDQSYYPKLCLVQIAISDACYLIDPLADAINLEPLWSLLTNPKVIKVFHSAKQDIETIYHITGHTISPLFDTQVAAMACGFITHTSYASLVQHYLNITLDKSSQFSAWDRRPLSDQQLHYAAADVIHLYKLYGVISNYLTEQNRLHWLSEEIDELIDPASYIVDPERIWEKMTLRKRTPTYAGILKSMCKWRELEAQAANKPKGRILKDGLLLTIASHPPKTIKQLYEINGTRHLSHDKASDLLAHINHGKANPINTLPSTPAMGSLTPHQKHLVDLLKIALYAKAHQHRIAEKLIASSASLAEFVLDPSTPLAMMQGWRHDIFGADAYDILNGSIGIKVDNNHINLISL